MKQQIHLVTGKGGVGKSVYAAALAHQLSKNSKNVLLVELGDSSFYKDFFNLERVDFIPVALFKGVEVALWTGKECLYEYAKHLVKVETLVKLFFENPIMRTFVNVAPALQELAIMGKVTSQPRKHGPPLMYDYIVVDCFSSGHFKALMAAPKSMAQVIPVGPMGEQSRGIDKILRDPEVCKYHVVTLPEELPLKETIELAEELKTSFGIMAKVIVNKKISPPFELQTEDELMPSDEKLFMDYLRSQIKNQNAAIHKYFPDGDRLLQIPFFYISDSSQLVNKVRECL